MRFLSFRWARAPGGFPLRKAIASTMQFEMDPSESVSIYTGHRVPSSAYIKHHTCGFGINVELKRTPSKSGACGHHILPEHFGGGGEGSGNGFASEGLRSRLERGQDVMTEPDPTFRKGGN